MVNTLPGLTVPDPRYELSQLGPDDPEAESVPDAGEVVDVERLVALHLLVSRSAIVLLLQPGEHSHVEGLVQPGAPAAGDRHLVAAVRGRTLLPGTRPRLSPVPGLAPASSHCPGDDAPPPHPGASTAGLGAGGPGAPPAPHTVSRAGTGLTSSPLLQRVAVASLTSHQSAPSELPSHPTTGGAAGPGRVLGVGAPLLLSLLLLEAGDLHSTLPLALPGLGSVQAASMPVTAGAEVLRLPDTPAQTSGVPEQDSVLLLVSVDRPVRSPADLEREGVDILPVTLGELRIADSQEGALGHSRSLG